MRIAIIEDEPVELAQLVQQIKNIRKKDTGGVGFEITKYQTIMEFEQADQNADLLLLDLHLPDGNGLEIAKKLKETHSYTGVIIITAYQEHVYEGYEVGAFRFLPKPVDSEKLKEAVLHYVDEYRSMKYLLVPTSTDQLILPLDEIVCIESQSKHSVIYMDNGDTYDSKRSIAEFTAEIENNSFFRVHRRYMVNMRHIVRLEDNKIVFDMDRCHAEISRRNRSDFETRFAAFLKTL